MREPPRLMRYGIFVLTDWDSDSSRVSSQWLSEQLNLRVRLFVPHEPWSP